MIIAQKIEKYHKNRIERIKKMTRGIDRDMDIGSLIADLGKRSIRSVSIFIGCSWRKAKRCFELYTNNSKQLSLEFRGRKRITDKFPHLKQDIENIIEKYKNVDPHFKTVLLYITISPKTVIEELIINYHYPKDFACYNTIRNLLNNMGYKLKRISKSIRLVRKLIN